MPGTAEDRCWKVEGRSWCYALAGEGEANHWSPGSPVEEAGGRRAPASRPPVGVVVGEQRGLVDQISVRPWLSQEPATSVEEEGEETVVVEGRCCK